MGPNTVFWFQHDAREISPDIVSVFDDEAAPAHATRSRALELQLNVAANTATVKKAVLPPGKLLAALAIDGAIFRLTKGIVDHQARSAFAGATGRWPGEDPAKEDD